MMESIYITPSEFARHMSCDISTIRHWIHKGKVKAIILKNPQRNHYRIPLSEVERLETELAEKSE